MTMQFSSGFKLVDSLNFPAIEKSTERTTTEIDVLGLEIQADIHFVKSGKR